MTLFRKGVFADVSYRSQDGSSWISGGPKSRDVHVRKGEDTPTQRRRACEDRGRHWRDEPPSQRAPGAVVSARSGEGGMEGFSLKPPEGTNFAKTLISDFQPPDLERTNICCFKPPWLWYLVPAAPGASHNLEGGGGTSCHGDSRGRFV